ncbi:MAG TPA: hypothetical protein GX724_07775 [Fibrobacter sp.]|nr:hypothetical protein [Fibrobacter sp.]
MSFLKKLKLFLITGTVVLLAACAGSSSGGSSDDVYYEDDGTGTKRAVKKEKVDVNMLKESEKEAMSITEENHSLRREIFDAKHKLGIPVEQQSGE